MKSIHLILCAGMILASGIARAEENARSTIAVQVLDAMDYCGMLNQSLEQMKAAQIKQMQGRGGPTVVADINRSYELVKKFLDCNAMKNEAAQIYAEVFSEEELKGLLAFFQSDLGKNFNAKQPELMRRSMESSMKHLNDAMAAVARDMRREKEAAVKEPASVE
jgi:hypothetical protein